MHNLEDSIWRLGDTIMESGRLYHGVRETLSWILGDSIMDSGRLYHGVRETGRLYLATATANGLSLNNIM